MSGKLRVSKEFLSLSQKLTAALCQALKKKALVRGMRGAVCPVPGTTASRGADVEGADREDGSVARAWVVRVTSQGVRDTLGGQQPWRLAATLESWLCCFLRLVMKRKL